MKKLLLLCAMALQGWSSGAAAQLITFDDLSAPTYYGMG